MPDPKQQKQKIVYLLGAGATHAEKQLECKIQKAGLDKDGKLKNGLLAEQISKRVIKQMLKSESETLAQYAITEASLENPQAKPSIDIELFISLLEQNKTEVSENHARIFRKYFKKDICRNLIVGRTEFQPRLLPALIEWHLKNKNEEKLLGFLSLNYDSIFEKSFELKKRRFDYGMDVGDKPLWPHESDKGHWPLLKLHGSFDWFFDVNMDKILVRKSGNINTMQWIPPRLNKEYLNYPYNIIHGKAYELLVQCDILRVIGCGLNQNDIGLISLLFKTQKKGANPYSIDIIGSRPTRKNISERLGMLLTFAESFYENNDWGKLGKPDTENPFLDWLYFKIKNAPKSYLRDSKYLKNVRQIYEKN